MELIVGLRDKSVVETSGGKVVGSLVKSVLVEDLARLFSDCLLQVVIVHSDTRHMTLVSRNNARLLASRGLGRHVVCGGSVEVIIAPFEELIFGENLTNLVVAHGELSL